jgi:nucleoid-associated protein YgaU
MALRRSPAGGGGWQVVDRPRRVGLTIWRGREPYQMSVPFLFDGHSRGVSVENAISVLNQMQMGSDLTPPPNILIEGAIPVKGALWVIGDPIEWGEDVYWVADGEDYYRTRQDGTISFLQFNPEDFLEIRPQARKLTNRYLTKEGDSLRSIAKAILGDAEKWQDIAKAQSPPLRVVGSKVLPRNIELRIP